MAKINVILKAVLDTGKEQRQPGETVQMEADQAKKLAALGMVELPLKAAPAKAPTPPPGGGKGGGKTPPPNGGGAGGAGTGEGGGSGKTDDGKGESD